MSLGPLLLLLALTITACNEAAAPAVSAASAAQEPSASKADALPRTASGKPDLQGIWQAQGAAAAARPIQPTTRRPPPRP